jgi:hypothetical protein
MGGSAGNRDRRVEQCDDRIWSPGATGAVSLDEIETQRADAFVLDQPAVAALIEDAWSQYVGSLNRELSADCASPRPRYTATILSNSVVGARKQEQEAYGLTSCPT